MEGFTVDWELVSKGLAPLISFIGFLAAETKRSKFGAWV
jgi:hypothetical protein